MISSYATLPDLVIASGATVSNVFQGVYVFHDAIGLQIYSPDTLPETVYIEVNKDQQATNTSSGWKPYEVFDNAGVSINLFVPGAGKSQTYQEPIFAGSMRLKSTGAVGADRVFQVNKIWTT
jgi:hypothetical protein